MYMTFSFNYYQMWFKNCYKKLQTYRNSKTVKMCVDILNRVTRFSSKTVKRNLNLMELKVINTLENKKKTNREWESDTVGNANANSMKSCKRRICEFKK